MLANFTADPQPVALSVLRDHGFALTEAAAEVDGRAARDLPRLRRARALPAPVAPRRFPGSRGTLSGHDDSTSQASVRLLVGRARACGAAFDAASDPRRRPRPSSSLAIGSDLRLRLRRSGACTQTPRARPRPVLLRRGRDRARHRATAMRPTLRLGIRVRSAGDEHAAQDAVVDIWHCDAVRRGSAEPERSCAAPRSPTPRGSRVHDDLPRLVPRPHRAHPRQGPLDSEIALTTSFRRRGQHAGARRRAPTPAACGCGSTPR